MMSTTLRALGVVALLGGAACSSSGAAGSRVETRPFTQEMSRDFDDGADYIENVEDLGGRVAADWRSAIDRLARAADFIAVVHVETLTGSDDAASSRAYRLSSRIVGAPLHGAAPRDGLIDLRVEEGQGGYNTIRSNYTRLQARNFLLFARYYTDSEGAVRPHWHLTPDTRAAQQRARDALGLVDPNAPTETIVRTN